MAVASFQSPAIVYREEQYFDWWVYAVLLVISCATWGGLLWHQRGAAAAPLAAVPLSTELRVGLLFGLFLPAALIVGLLRMTTEVTPAHLRVWFGWFPTYRRVIATEAIRRVEVVTYRPIADCGGWGIRSGRDGERVYNARGNRGVRIELADGSRLLIGSQRPEQLADALERAMMRPGS